MEMTKADFDTWVKALQPLNCIAGVFRVTAVNQYGLDWCEARIKNMVSRMLSGWLAAPVKVEFELAQAVEELNETDRLGRRQPEKVGYYPNRGTNQQRGRYGEIP